MKQITDEMIKAKIEKIMLKHLEEVKNEEERTINNFLLIDMYLEIEGEIRCRKGIMEKDPGLAEEDYIDFGCSEEEAKIKVGKDNEWNEIMSNYINDLRALQEEIMRIIHNY